MSPQQPSVAFRPPLDRVDRLVLKAARRRNPNVTNLERAKAEPPFSLAQLLPHDLSKPYEHFGPTTTLLWHLTYELFISATKPPGAEAKSVQVADVFVAPAGSRRTGMLVV